MDLVGKHTFIHTHNAVDNYNALSIIIDPCNIASYKL